MNEKRILVVGTTRDYIEYIQGQYPGRVLFITDEAEWSAHGTGTLEPKFEIACDLSDQGQVIALLDDRLGRQDIELTGITCYDCEWLELTAHLAVRFNLKYVSPEAVKRARNKYLCKKLWHSGGVRCPRVKRLQSMDEAVEFQRQINKPIVLKPLSGSGSELTFLCQDYSDIESAYRALKIGLHKRREWPMYRPGNDSRKGNILAEEYIDGQEYSCDLVISQSHAAILRIAKKLGRFDYPFGTTAAYIVPAYYSTQQNGNQLIGQLSRAAAVLGIEHALVMVDFMVMQDEVVLLEMTPRIGGDCLPPLVKMSSGMDTIGVALDFAEGKKWIMPNPTEWKETVGVRFFAPTAGVFKGINILNSLDDPRIQDIYLKRSSGHRVVMPPEDYDSWLLGHILFHPDNSNDLASQCSDILGTINIEMEPFYDPRFDGLHRRSHPTA
jgi:biotin carboxylase